MGNLYKNDCVIIGARDAMKTIALLIGGIVAAFGAAIFQLKSEENNMATIFDQKPKADVSVAATNWKLPAGRKVEWAVFGSG